MTSPTIAVVVRTQDGVFQPMLLGVKPNATLYRLTGCVLRKVTRHGTSPCIVTLRDLPADVFVFVNVPVETTNHMFLEALAEQAMHEDCGLASGLLINEKRIILSPDPYAGQVLKPQAIQEIRSITNLSPHFFATRRDRLLSVGGLGVISSERMPELLRHLTDAAHKANLQLLVTPYAVAELSSSNGSSPGL
ncbi:MAG: hypothetical protein M3Y72_18895 [Acidobacteriota bacterium]|nr:hypothetical protein [Acidobacteriota bacterium]